MLPSGLKKQLDPVVGDGFVVKRALYAACLEVYPIDEWNLLMEKMNKLNRFIPENVDFIRSFTAGVTPVEVDATGRVLVPKHLLSFAGLDKELVLASMIETFEIWDKTKYEEKMASVSPTQATMAQKIMGTPAIPDGLS